MNRQPLVSIIKSPDGQSYAIDGWEEFNRWGNMNDALWNSTDRQCKELGISEEDKIKIQVYRLFVNYEQLQQAGIELQMRNPQPPIVIKQ